MRTATINIPVIPEHSQVTIILDDLEFGFERWELDEAARRWEKGSSFESIVEFLYRKPEEVFLALFHLARSGRITRPFAWRKANG